MMTRSIQPSIPLPASPTREVEIERGARSIPTHRPTPSPVVGRAGDGAGRLLGAILLLVALLFALPATAAETIRNFNVAITLQTDGTVDVTETITVMAEGNEIRRGIFRDIPTTLINEDNSRLRSLLKVISVQRNGRAEPYAIEDLTTGIKRIRIGDADVFLNYGVHTYIIRYTMSRMGRFFADHDELYWNATGNYWNFPIAASVTKVTLPPGAVISNLAGYTGVPGSTEQAVSVARTSNSTATFTLTRPLRAGEGVTVAVAFQKGILVAPTGLKAGLNWISDHRDLVFPALAVLLVLAYNLIAWTAVGRDPEKGTIIPLFHPPAGFSPALVHFVHRMGWANMGWTAFTASIFNLGVKGLVSIDNTGSKLKITVTNKTDTTELSPAEQLVYRYINSKGSLVIDTANGAAINTKREEFLKAVASENRAVYFNNNALFVFGGVALSAVLLGGLVLFGILDPAVLIFSAIGGFVVGTVFSIFQKVLSGGVIGKIILFAWIILGGGNLLGAISSFASDIRFDNSLFAAASIIIINIVFGVLMRAPTVQGRKLMDQIDGFKMYLETAEKNRLNFQGAPAMTVSRFESLLPFAIALGVEKPWSEHFEGELERHAVADADTDYSPGWYRGNAWSSSGGFSRTVAAATSGMSAAMISAQPASSSSSGFSSGGGGGSSGGGGGGGGGGGW